MIPYTLILNSVLTMHESGKENMMYDLHSELRLPSYMLEIPNVRIIETRVEGDQNWGVQIGDGILPGFWLSIFLIPYHPVIASSTGRPSRWGMALSSRLFSGPFVSV